MRQSHHAAMQMIAPMIGLTKLRMPKVRRVAWKMRRCSPRVQREVEGSEPCRSASFWFTPHARRLQAAELKFFPHHLWPCLGIIIMV